MVDMRMYSKCETCLDPVCVNYELNRVVNHNQLVFKGSSDICALLMRFSFCPNKS